jgi:ATP-dependent DNA helicase RecG
MHEEFEPIAIKKIEEVTESESKNRQSSTNANGTVNETVNDTVNDTVNSTALAILSEINKNGNITVDELCQLTSKSRSTVLRAIATLKGKNIIARIGSDKSGYWDIL